jgi:arsenate reductase
VPAGYIHPLAVQAMAELGIDIAAQRSKSADEFRGAGFDAVITLCDQAAQNCPLWLGSGQVMHLGFPDPAAATGSRDEQLDAFRQVRDNLRREVLRRLDDGDFDRLAG